MAQIVDSKQIARTMTFDGRNVNVMSHTYDSDLPGVGNKTVSVSVSGNANNPEQTFGFKDWNDARKFLTSFGEVDFPSHDMAGNETTVKREGLGLSDGMIATYDVPTEQPAEKVNPTEDTSKKDDK